MSMLGWLFGRKTPEDAELREDRRVSLARAIDNGSTMILAANLALLGLRSGAVPLEGSTGSRRSRGYVFGLVDALVDRHAEDGPDKEMFIACTKAAFAYVYGEAGEAAALDTIELWRVGDAEVLAGIEVAHGDVGAAFGRDTSRLFTGFWQMNRAEAQAA